MYFSISTLYTKKRSLHKIKMNILKKIMTKAVGEEFLNLF